MSLFAELRRRKVFKVGGAYAVVGWLLIQVATTVAPQLVLPDWAPRLITFLIILGFPIALVMAWVFDVTPDGVKLDARTTGSARMYAVAAVLMALATAWYIHGRPAQPAQTPTGANATNVASRDSIAVMPFADLSEHGDQAYFSDGMSEELLDLLAQVPGLRVAGRTSSLSFKGKNATVAEIGRALHVGTLLEGSVRKTGDRLRITVQLTDVADGFQIWSQSYDRKQDDIFAIQDEIAGAVVDALKLKLLPASRPSSSKHHVPGFEAYSQYLIGRNALIRSDEGSLQVALDAFRRAVALDPKYAEGFAGLAMAESFAVEDVADPAEAAPGFRRAAAAAERSVELDPGLGDAYASRGYVRSVDNWDWNGAMADLAKAIELSPGDARNQLRYGYLLATMGRLAEASSAFDTGIRQDPLLTPLWYWSGRIKAAQGDFKGAGAALDRAIEINPDFHGATSYLGTIALLRGDAASARSIYAKSGNQYGLAMAEYDLGHRAEAERALHELVAAHASDSPYTIATVYAWRGDRDKAFEWLESAFAKRDNNMFSLKYDPLLRKVRDDPRYISLLERTGLPK